MSNDSYEGIKMIFLPLFKKEIKNGNHPIIAFANAADEAMESFELTEEEKTEFVNRIKSDIETST
jgi:hypothetical protein